jgi:hypothetical protein
MKRGPFSGDSKGLNGFPEGLGFGAVGLLARAGEKRSWNWRERQLRKWVEDETVVLGWSQKR